MAVKGGKVIETSHHEPACAIIAFAQSGLSEGVGEHDGLVYASCIGTRRQAHVSAHGARGMDEWCARVLPILQSRGLRWRRPTSSHAARTPFNLSSIL